MKAYNITESDLRLQSIFRIGERERTQIESRKKTESKRIQRQFLSPLSCFVPRCACLTKGPSYLDGSPLRRTSTNTISLSR